MHEQKIQYRPSLPEWQQAIANLKNKGCVVCPLLIKEAGRYKSELCVCDVPQTQEQFLQQAAMCTDGEACLPRIQMPESARAELNRKRW